MMQSTRSSTAAGSATASEVSGRSDGHLDMLVLESRLSESARHLLEAMGVSIRPVRWQDVAGPRVVRLLAPETRPRLYWMDSARAEDLLDALTREQDHINTPAWVHHLLSSHRAGALTGMDGGIDFGEEGLDVTLVLRDLLRYPVAL